MNRDEKKIEERKAYKREWIRKSRARKKAAEYRELTIKVPSSVEAFLIEHSRINGMSTARYAAHLLKANFEASKRYYAEQERIKLRSVGRNDPCPCGSGKKAKQCCKR